MTERLRKAGTLQTFTMIVFMAAACMGGVSLMLGSYVFAAINGVLMVINFALYQQQSAIIKDELSRNAR